MLNIFLETTEPDNGWMTWVLIGLLVVMLFAVVVVPMFTRNKKQKEADEGKRFLRPGDKIKTVGGIVGIIVEVKDVSAVEKELIIETGAEGRKTTMTVDVNALYIIMERGAESRAALEKARQEKLEAEAARIAEKEARKSGGYNRNAVSQPRVTVFEDTLPDEAQTVSESVDEIGDSTITD